MISRTMIHEPESEPLGMIVALAGRGLSVSTMFSITHELGLYRSILVTLEPHRREWYPQPNGPEDQKESLRGVALAMPSLLKRLREIRAIFGMTLGEMALFGYSAGGVMALKVAEEVTQDFAAVACMAGTILDAPGLAPAQNNTPILLRHNEDDEVFDWYERHIPTREALIKQGYNLSVDEHHFGGHSMCLADCHTIGRFLAAHLGYFS